jgi:hypothetical protein
MCLNLLWIGLRAPYLLDPTFISIPFFPHCCVFFFVRCTDHTDWLIFVVNCLNDVFLPRLSALWGEIHAIMNFGGHLSQNRPQRRLLGKRGSVRLTVTKPHLQLTVNLYCITSRSPWQLVVIWWWYHSIARSLYCDENCAIWLCWLVIGFGWYYCIRGRH